MRTLLFLLALALIARAQMHPSLPEPGTLDGRAGESVRAGAPGAR